MKWIAQFDSMDPMYSAESHELHTSDDADAHIEAQKKAIGWLGSLHDPPYNFRYDIPRVKDEWRGDYDPITGTSTMMRDLEGGAWLTLFEVYEPR